MPANLLAGEVGIVAGGREYIFRPSFYRLATLDSPKGLIQLFGDVQRGDRLGFQCALRVLHQFLMDCSTEEADRLLGYYRDVRGVLKYVRGMVREPRDLQILALTILQNGMMGKPSKRRGNASEEFDPSEYIGFAVAHLGMGMAEARELTMHEFQSICVAKFGKPKDDDIPTAEDIDAMWEEVDRKQNNG